MRLTRVIHPFAPTKRLQDHLRQYLFEYGAIGREDLPWPEGVIGWQMADHYGAEVGYAWLHPGRNAAAGERWFDIAVYDEHRRRRFADATLKQIEGQLAELGIKTLRAQVNTNKPATGRIVRQWLLRSGFRVERPEEHAQWADLSHEEYSDAWPRIVKFSKTYPEGETTEGESAEDMTEAHYPPVIGSKIVDEMRRRKVIGEQA
jgi:GNAT superfamily N-acetyltransferase